MGAVGRLDATSARVWKSRYRWRCHFIFVARAWLRAADGEETRMVTVLDIEGLRFSEVNKPY